jgi:site-specific recombinase XerD
MRVMPKPPARAQGSPAPALAEHLESAAGYAAEEKAEATRRAYGSDWRQFEAWCHTLGCSPLPASSATVASYLAHLADSGRKASTIARRLAAIAYAHKLRGLEPPTATEAVNVVMRGIRRSIGVAPVRKAPATAALIRSMVNCIPIDTHSGLRDRAILLLGFAAALRRSELVDLKVKDLEFGPEGVVLHIRRSKTDQEGKGATIPVPRGRMGAIEAVEAWLELLPKHTYDVPIFREIVKGGCIGTAALTDRSVARIIKRCAGAAGLDPKSFSGHSLRAGFVTSALEHGADIFKVMDVTRHKRIETLKGYDRRAQAFRDHAGKDFL